MFEPLQFRAARSSVEICFDLDNACIELSRHMKADPAAKKAVLSNAARQLLRAARQTSILSYAILGGIKPEEPRAAQLAEAQTYRTGLLAEGLETARKALADAGVVGAAPLMADARERLQALDLGVLLHSDPCMELATGREGDRRTCIGPHGDFRKSQEFGFLCQHYMREWCLEWCNLFDQTSADRRLMAECLGLYAHLVKMQHQAGALVTGISTYWRWDNLNAFHKVLKACSLLTKSEGGEGTPAVYFAFGLSWADLSSANPAYRAGSKRIFDSWQKNDGWVEWMLVFPNALRFPATT